MEKKSKVQGTPEDVVEEMLTDMFGEGGKEEIKEAYNQTKLISKSSLIKQIEKMREDNLGETPSHNEDMGVENMYDWISSSVGFEEDKKELREGIRLFGKMRFNQALEDIIKLIKEQ